ncbi:FAD-dependent pyridine nucleotide-disulfide oxidoreductase [Pseudothermotoga hypogea DSM 11164 = NBRC 106472]|uniref:FAD-dependent pyridine nucleotide-disulfide oxidoreductase n=2 Tax=Pseudothermotoga hypogea TaxID=57487 RepID=A0A0X1KT69_9THEM|nr:FAD-dependent oxidoreductase [Pseudothermotoga hypogea]AJC74465.1 FAD-dependent pyridine nucleotide-disulfide oxidoreductase [Pseudothermotoga hypogea DSM 11164 = NBRC 106472]
MRYDVVVVGGGPAGLVAALTTKKFYKDKKVLVIKKTEKELVPCGIPYVFHTLDGVENDFMGVEERFQKAGIDLLIDEVVGGDTDQKKIVTKTGKEIIYEKLILATGSIPAVPRIAGIDLSNVFTISKDAKYLSSVLEKTRTCRNIAIIGGGFIGIEVADELKRAGKNVTVVEIMDCLLPVSFDPDFGELARKEIEAENLKVYTSRKVVEIYGSKSVEGVKLDNGENIPADAVILATGYKPNTELARQLGLKITEYGFIETDEYMRTSKPDVFAAGDCVQHKDFLTGKPSRLMLASAAVFDARIVASNLYGLKVIRTNKGSLNAYSTVIGHKAFGSVGITERTAKEEGFEIVVGKAEGIDRHPGKFDDTSKLIVKLIFSQDSRILLGAQLYGGKSVGEIVNILSLGIQKGITANDLFTMQIGTHPLLTSAPTSYPLVIAAEQVLH